MPAELRTPRATPFVLKLSVGGEQRHESSAWHHIRWIRVYFLPQDRNRPPLEVGSFTFHVHGDTSGTTPPAPVCSAGSVHCVLTLNEPGELLIWAFCSLHGFSERRLHVHLTEDGY